MLHATLQIVLYAVLAGLSPLAFAAALATVHAGRPKALAFGVGFVGAQLATCGLLIALDREAVGSGRSRHSGLQIVLDFVVAVLLVIAAGTVRRRPVTAHQGNQSERTRRILERLTRLRVGTTLAAGIVLGIGVPKRLLLSALAMTTISTSGLHATGETTLVAVYVVIATALVWAPVILFVFLGERAVAVMKRAQAEVTRRQPGIAVYALLGLAALFLIEGTGSLLTR